MGSADVAMTVAYHSSHSCAVVYLFSPCWVFAGFRCSIRRAPVGSAARDGSASTRPLLAEGSFVRPKAGTGCCFRPNVLRGGSSAAGCHQAHSRLRRRLAALYWRMYFYFARCDARLEPLAGKRLLQLAEWPQAYESSTLGGRIRVSRGSGARRPCFAVDLRALAERTSCLFIWSGAAVMLATDLRALVAGINLCDAIACGPVPPIAFHPYDVLGRHFPADWRRN